ncbi:MAG: YihY/virulence factor BrkB family protein [Anaerolineae bacterium]
MPDDLKSRLTRLYRRADRATGGALAVLRTAVRRYGDTQASQAAAGLAYYIFFSLFPLLLVLVTAASYIWNLGSDAAFRRAVDFIAQALPVSQDLIASNLDTVLQLRGTIGLVSLAGTLWSASGAFTILTQKINEAWSNTEARSFVRKRLVGLALVAGVVLLLLLSLAATTAASLFPQLAASIPAPLTRLLPFVFTLFMFLALYRWIPTASVSWRAALWGAGSAGLAWELAKGAFAWFVSSGLSNYRLVYGSLGSVVALLFWIYISASITLFGAHLTAALDTSRGLDSGRQTTDDGRPTTQAKHRQPPALSEAEGSVVHRPSPPPSPNKKSDPQRSRP